MKSSASRSRSVGRVLAEVRVRREEQDAKWGGPKHDDMHLPFEWLGYFRKFIFKASNFVYTQIEAMSPRLQAMALSPDWESYEDALLDIAALAVAAIQSSRRKRNA